MWPNCYAKPGHFDVIALDVDNGPEGLTKSANDWLYSMSGIAAAQNALSLKGILAYWSADPDQAFHDRLRRCGFMVEEVTFLHMGKRAQDTRSGWPVLMGSVEVKIYMSSCRW